MRHWVETLTAALPMAVAGTLVCCALPIVLVALGAGSVMAAIVETAPWLVALSRHRDWIFVAVGILLAFDYWVLYRSQTLACAPGGRCAPERPLGRWLRRVYWGSVALYGVGFAAAYLTLPIAEALG